jgi:hypothetical protein
MHAVQISQLTPYQMIAADVTGNGSVSAMDASYVLRYYVGLISGFPVDEDWKFVPVSFPINNSNWAIAPDSIRFQPLNADKANQDFVGIVYGDVSGNWTALSTPMLARATDPPKLKFGNLEQNKDGTCVLPILLDKASDVFSFGLSFQYDQNQFQLLAAELTATHSESPLFAYSDHQGKLKLGLAATKPMNQIGPIVKLIFKPKEGMQNAESALFSIGEFSINGQNYTTQLQAIETSMTTETPDHYELFQNYPNPFNATTTIKYSLAENAHVKVSVYNHLGQVVAVLVDGYQSKGAHSITWNASHQPSGIYFYKLKADAFTASRKMFLQK